MRIIALLTTMFSITILVPAYAWKIETHIWLADQLWSEVRSKGAVQLPIGQFPVPPLLRTAIATNRGPFLLGVLGPDSYPDMIAGQFTTHPGLEAPPIGPRPLTRQANALLMAADPAIKDLNEDANALTQRGPDCFRSLRVADPKKEVPLWQTDDWLCWVRHQGLSAGAGGREAAFAYGYLIHAAMDMWAHSYVNLYAGDIWSLKEEQEVELRHMGIESVIARTHRTFLEEPGSMTQQEAFAEFNKQLKDYVGNLASTVSEQKDGLTYLRAPLDFVRKHLILNPAVANQYAREDMTTHLFAMYVYWAQVGTISAQLGPLRSSINAAAGQLAQGVSQAQGAFTAAQTAYNNSVQAAEAAYNAFKEAEKAANRASEQFEKARKDAFGVIDNITDQMVAALPPFLKQPYEDAKKARNAAFNALDARRDDYNRLAKARDQKKEAMQDALETVNLRRSAQTLMDQARTQTLVAFDAGVNTWRTGIENAVDAYILAWEETSKELIRPPGSRFSPGHDVTEPLKQWVRCWGRTFGLPVLAQVAPVCDMARTAYQNANKNLNNLKLLAQNALIPQPIRERIEALDKLMAQTSGFILVETGKLVSRAILIDQNGVLGGHARSLINLRLKTPNAQEVDDEFDDNTAGKDKQLVTYPRFSQLIASDMGVPHAALTQLLAQNPRTPTPNMQARLTLSQLGTFSALQNSYVMAKLTLLDGFQLNKLTPLTATLAPYTSNAPAGEVLIGALRSIDGDHQWQKFAPYPPRRPSIDCSRKWADGSPQDAYCHPRMFGYDACDTGKGGLKLWQNPQLRAQVFNNLFKGPLTPSLVAFLGPGNLPPGIGTTVTDPYPPSTKPATCSSTSTALTPMGTVQMAVPSSPVNVPPK